MLPGAMNPNAGMSEQEQQMVKAVRHATILTHLNSAKNGN